MQPSQSVLKHNRVISGEDTPSTWSKPVRRSLSEEPSFYIDNLGIRPPCKSTSSENVQIIAEGPNKAAEAEQPWQESQASKGSFAVPEPIFTSKVGQNSEANQRGSMKKEHIIIKPPSPKLRPCHNQCQEQRSPVLRLLGKRGPQGLLEEAQAAREGVYRRIIESKSREWLKGNLQKFEQLKRKATQLPPGQRKVVRNQMCSIRMRVRTKVENLQFFQQMASKDCKMLAMLEAVGQEATPEECESIIKEVSKKWSQSSEKHAVQVLPAGLSVNGRLLHRGIRQKICQADNEQPKNLGEAFLTPRHVMEYLRPTPQQ